MTDIEAVRNQINIALRRDRARLARMIDAIVDEAVADLNERYPMPEGQPDPPRPLHGDRPPNPCVRNQKRMGERQ